MKIDIPLFCICFIFDTLFFLSIIEEREPLTLKNNIASTVQLLFSAIYLSHYFNTNSSFNSTNYQFLNVHKT